jgi:hypothetical protein
MKEKRTRADIDLSHREDVTLDVLLEAREGWLTVNNGLPESVAVSLRGIQNLVQMDQEALVTAMKCQSTDELFGVLVRAAMSGTARIYGMNIALYHDELRKPVETLTTAWREKTNGRWDECHQLIECIEELEKLLEAKK